MSSLAYEVLPKEQRFLCWGFSGAYCESGSILLPYADSGENADGENDPSGIPVSRHTGFAIDRYTDG